MYSSIAFNRQTIAPADDVFAPNKAWQDMSEHWVLIEDLIQGTSHLRSKQRKYLFQELRENDESYENRLSRSTCPPFLSRIEKMLAGMLTRKPVRLIDVPDRINEQLFDVDLAGNDITLFTFNTAQKMLRYGHVGVLVDAPRSIASGRPYWVTYTPREILGWRTEQTDGTLKLTQLRLLETVVEPDGKYGERNVEQVRVLTPGAFEIHRRKDSGEFEVVDEGTTGLNEIPFAVAYANRYGFLESRPPLEDIAELNLKAYQIQSDLDNQLHISSVPFLAIYGYPASAEEITAGPGEALALPSESKVEFVSPPSDGFDAQFRRLDQIADQINTLGLAAVLGQKLSAETAESKRIDRSQGDSVMQVISQQMQDLIDNCLRFHAAYLGERQAGSSFINRDFLGQRLQPQDIQALLQLFTAGTITQETLLQQLSEGEVLGDDFDVEAEVEATEMGGLSGTQEPEPEEQEEGPESLEDEGQDEEVEEEPDVQE